MNTLEHYIEYKRLNPVRLMNALQNNGIISDECIFPDEVRDSGQAVYWLEDHIGEIHLS